MPLYASDMITRIRRMLDQVPLTDEDVKTDSAVIGTPSTQFSDENLLQRINHAQREIIARVKAQHVPLSIQSYTGPFPDVALPVFRLLFSRVFHSGTGGGSGTYTAYDPQGFFDGAPDDEEIIYIFIASRNMNINDLTVTADAAGSTSDLTVKKNGASVGTVTLATDGSGSTTMSPFTMIDGDVLTISADAGFVHENIFINFDAEAEVILAEDITNGRCVQRSVDRHRRLEQAGRSATSEFPVYTYEDEQLNIYPDADNATAYFVVAPDEITPTDLANGTDELTIDERTQMALIYYVVSTCYQTMRRPDLQAWALEEFVDELDPYALYNRHNLIFDDREVDVE
jgi:hypothetical protein